jgi:KUP system potassium uptake protein
MRSESAPQRTMASLRFFGRPQSASYAVSTASPKKKSPAALAALTLAALGIVYGDIGTSPLYALKEIFHGGHVAATPDNILGVLSLVFWTITVVISLKYVLLILRADNHGEGGLIAMLALATSAVRDRPPLRRALMTVGLFGTAVFYGDGVITPAISVLSAVEGLEVAAPKLHDWVIPITLLVLTGLFAAQRFGTGGIGKLFGPWPNPACWWR